MRVHLFQSYLGSQGISDQLVFPNGLTCVAMAPHSRPQAELVEETARLREMAGAHRFRFTDTRFDLRWQHAQALCQAALGCGLQLRRSACLGLGLVAVEGLGLQWEPGGERAETGPEDPRGLGSGRSPEGIRAVPGHMAISALRGIKGLRASWSLFCPPPSNSWRQQIDLLLSYARMVGSVPGRGRMLLTWCRVETELRRCEGGVAARSSDGARVLERLCYVPPGFEAWSSFWDRFRDQELGVETATAQSARPMA